MANLLKLGVYFTKINITRQSILYRPLIVPIISQRIQQYASGRNLKSDMPVNAKDRVISRRSTAEELASRSASTHSSKKPNLMWLVLVAAATGGAGLIYYLMNSEKDTVQETIRKLPVEEEPKITTRIPATSAEIPKEIPYLLIGGGTASFSAFRAIKSNDPKAKIMVITDELQIPYMRPPLSKEMWLNAQTGPVDAYKFKQWNGAERSLFYEPNDFYTDPSRLLDEQNGGVTIVRGYTVKKIDVCNRSAILTDGTEIKYGECLLATGSQPKNLDIFRAAPLRVKQRISVYKTIDDFERLKATIDRSKTVAVIGGGFLGSELACALAKYGRTSGLKVFQVFHESGNMDKVLPEYLSRWTTERVRAEGVDVQAKAQIESVQVRDGQLELTMNVGTSLLVDHVIVAVGSQPNVQLAVDSGLEVDPTLGGYVVNAELEARRHLYVAGDAACFYDPKLGRRRVEHHDHAVVSGRLAGENMVGQKKPYKHQSMFWSDLGANVGYEAIGLVDSTLPTVGIFAKPSPRPINVAGDDRLKVDESDGKTNEQIDSIPSESMEQKVVTSDSAASDSSVSVAAIAVLPTIADGDNYGKGVIFYLRNEIVVGIVLWNVFNRINIARVIIGEGKKYDDLNEVAKLFDLHS